MSIFSKTKPPMKKILLIYFFVRITCPSVRYYIKQSFHSLSRYKELHFILLTAKICVKFCKQTRTELPCLLALSWYSLLTLSLYFIFPLWSVPAYELSHPAVDHAVCILRIASLLSACLTISLSHFLPFFPPPRLLFHSFTLSLSLFRSFSYHDSRSASSRRDEVRGKLKYADFYRRPRAVNERMGEPGMKNEKGLDHKGCGRPDFTGRRVLGNYRTFKVRKGSVTHYLTLDTSIVKSSTPPVFVTLASYPSR